MIKGNVSILITNYNKEKYLTKSIQSCLSQNFKNKEIFFLMIAQQIIQLKF